MGVGYTNSGLNWNPNYLNQYAQQGQGQQPGGMDWMSMLGPATMNPYLAAGTAGLSALGGFVDTQGKKNARWQSGQVKDLYDKLRWGGDTKPYMSNNDILSQMANFKQSITPQTRDIRFGANSQTSGGEAERMISNSLAPILAGRQGQLQDMNTQMTFQADQAKLQAMLRLLGMM